jgi:hypothetical protein
MVTVVMVVLPMLIEASLLAGVQTITGSNPNSSTRLHVPMVSTAIR